MIMEIKMERISSKLKLDQYDLDNWMEDYWVLYASQMFQGKMLRLDINGNSIFRVTYGDTQLYQGLSRVTAVDVWNDL